MLTMKQETSKEQLNGIRTPVMISKLKQELEKTFE